MKDINKKILLVLLAAILSSGLITSTATALTVNLTASEKTMAMPDGESVPMWGYYISGDLTYGTAFGLNGPPVIRATTTDSLTIDLVNELTNPLGSVTSVVIPGQTATEAGAMVPTWTDGSTGSIDRTVDTTGRRVRSFTHETDTGAGVTSYTWNTLKAGTYLIQSGTHPGVQVPMGLYAVLIVDQGAAGTAYTPAGGPAINYATDVPLLFSEVDPLQHQAVAAGTYGTAAYPTTMAAGYQASYFLINGLPYSPDRSPIYAGANSTDILLRFLNAGLETRIPAIQDTALTVLAEDGNPFTTISGNLQQYNQHSIDLMAGKTMDAIFNSATDAYYPVYDRRLGLVNGMASGGGMTAFLEVGTPSQTLDVAFAGSSTGTGSIQTVSLPGGIDSSVPDLTEDYLTNTEVSLRATADPGSALTGWLVTDSVGSTTECTQDPYADCVVTMDDNKTVTATFTSYTQATVITPNGGENIPSGSGYTIRWGAPVTDMTFSLAYSFGAGTPWQSIATDLTGNQYVWTVPAGLPDQGPLFIAITGYDNTGTKTWTDISDAAALRYANALTAPNGGESWPAASPIITWNSALVPGTVASIGLWYRTAPATTWQLITVLQNDHGSFDWTATLPAEVSTTAEVGIIFYDAAGEPLYIDISDGQFNLN